MRRVYLIRHGLPDFPGGERMCLGITDLPLAPEGFQQAKEMAQKLPPVTAVFSSQLLRAVQTAQAIGKEVKVIPGLREYYAGAWDGLTFRQIREQYPALYQARGREPYLPLPEGEDHELGLARFAKAMEECAGSSTGDFAVVAHGGVIAAYLESLGGQRKKPGYAQMIFLEYRDGKFFIQEETNHA